MRSTIDLAATAREHLTPQVAETWIGPLQPAVQLTSEGDEGSVVGYLGGEPDLPESQPVCGLLKRTQAAALIGATSDAGGSASYVTSEGLKSEMCQMSGGTSFGNTVIVGIARPGRVGFRSADSILDELTDAPAQRGLGSVVTVVAGDRARAAVNKRWTDQRIDVELGMRVAGYCVQITLNVYGVSDEEALSAATEIARGLAAQLTS